ncbi:hypothetical protein TWF694_005406 [Orbilia ellipsospora]|uniref:F-box domain-containing protein n=1 Tax=Orbilia ellipsospora TaxID=2528407 RepID=A0AAV9WUK6_9PEZI
MSILPESPGVKEAFLGPSSQISAQKSAPDQVFETFELLEHILLQIPPKSLMKLRGVNRTFNITIMTSPIIKWAIFRHPAAAIPPSILRDPRLQGYISYPVDTNVLEIHPLIERGLWHMWDATIHIDRRSTRMHPFNPEAITSFPDDVFITRPPVKTLCITTNGPDSDITVLEASEHSPGITMKQFLNAIAGPCLDRYRELLATSKSRLPNLRRGSVAPEICIRIREVYENNEQAREAMLKVRARARN